jgi:hypothetical protein
MSLALVSAFLVGCGSSGGGSSSDDKGTTLSFSKLEAVFDSAPFPTSGLTANIVSIEKDKVYNATQAEFDEFYASVLVPGEYVLDSGWYGRFDIASNIAYFAKSNSTASTLQVAIYSNSNFAGLTDSVFDDEFDTIDGTLTEIFIQKVYDADISSKYDTYALSTLSPSGFKCTNGASTDYKWRCSNDKIDDKFTYWWAEVDNYKHRYFAIPK